MGGHYNSYQGIAFRQSKQFTTAIKLGREMLEIDGRMVLDLPVNEEEDGGEDDPGEDHPDEEEEEPPIQERDQGVQEKVNGARKAPFNFKVRLLSKESTFVLAF